MDVLSSPVSVRVLAPSAPGSAELLKDTLCDNTQHSRPATARSAIKTLILREACSGVITERAGSEDLQALPISLPGIELERNLPAAGRSILVVLRHAQVAVVECIDSRDWAVETVNWLYSSASQIRIVVASRYHDCPFLKLVLRAGAQGYVRLPTRHEDLGNAIRAIAAGGMYIDPTVATHIAASFVGVSERDTAACPVTPNAHVHKSAEVNLHPPLSGRERDVLQMIALGYGNKEIAANLTVSVKTVETYKSRAMDKLSLRSRVDLVRFALDNGWLMPAASREEFDTTNATSRATHGARTML